MYRVINPKYSFVQFAFEQDVNSCGNVSDCLPVILFDDVAFQLLIEADTPAELYTLLHSTPLSNLKLLLLSGGGVNSESEVFAKQIIDYADGSKFFQLYQVSSTSVMIYWPHGLIAFDERVTCEECFRMAIDFTIGEQHIVLPSNCFYRSCDECFTSVLEYSCDENAYGFYYCQADSPNRVRLPLHVSKPQFNDDESIYVRSDGSIKVLKSVTKKEFEGFVDYLSADDHEKIKIALSHDTLLMESGEYTGELRKNGSYEIDWNEFPGSKKAPAKFKAFATPYSVRNDNCAACDPFVCEKVSFVEHVLPDAVAGEYYFQQFLLNGTPPFLLVNEGLPVWLDASITGNVLTLSGTAPTDPATNVEVGFSVENCGGNSNFQGLDQFIDIVSPSSCLPVTNLRVTNQVIVSKKVNVTFEWNAPLITPASYDWVLMDGLFNQISTGNVSTLAKTITTLERNTVYRFRVISHCGYGPYGTSSPVDILFTTI